MKGKPVISSKICPEAQKYLQDLVDVMTKQDVLTSMDSAAIELIGNTYHTYITATNVLLKEGYIIKSAKGDTRAHPAVKIQLDAQIQLTKLFDAFGLNPKARKEIHKPKERERVLSPIDVFLEQAKEDR